MIIETSHGQNCRKIFPITDPNTGEITCANCGTVVSEKQSDFGHESSIDNSSRFNLRAGQKTSLKMADMGLSTIIEQSDRDSTGRTLPKENRRIFYRLRIWDRNSRSSTVEKSFNRAFLLLDAIRSKIGLPEVVVEQTAFLFRKISQKKILIGRSTQTILCATVYISCRLTNTPRTIQDIADAGNVKKKAIQRIYRFLIKELNINPISYTPNEFVTRLVNALNASEKTRRDALDILEYAQKVGISTSKNPMSMAAAAIHLSLLKNGEKISQTKVAEASGISAVTIRDRVKEIKRRESKHGQNL